MDQREQFLKHQLTICEPETAEHAALLTEFAGLNFAKGREDEAKCMIQKAYHIRMKEFMSGGGISSGAAVSSVQQHHGGSNHAACALAAGSAAPAEPECNSQQLKGAQPAAAPCNNAVSSVPAEDSKQSSQAGSQSPDDTAEIDAGWDKSDDWEPDLTVLRTASSFERCREQQQQQQSSSSSSSSSTAEAGPPAIAAGSWRQRSTSRSRQGTSVKPSDGPSWRSPVPRGRGESKCGAGSDSDGDWDTQLPVPNQPHVVEVYGLNRSVKTSHLEEFLLDFMWGHTMGTVKWVDDEHALAVFPCAEAAQALLGSTQSVYKVRPYSKASNAALQIAGEDLLPPRGARPKTTTAVARRLISNALGNREVRDRTAEKELAELRKANKQGRQQRQQQLDATWGEDD